MLKPMDKTFFDQFVGILKESAPSKEEYLLWKKKELDAEERKADR